MTRTQWVGLFALLGAVGFGGAMLGRMTAPAFTSVDSITCRPTMPEVAYADAVEPVILMWGNSLLFDHDWSGLPANVVNCARQGMTASQAQGLTAGLPAISPTHVLVAFGSVEAFRAGRTAEPFAQSDFANAIGAITGDFLERWPDAQIVLAHVPDFKSAPIRPADVAAINTVLNDIDGVTVLDLNGAFAKQGRPVLSYDGVHLTQQAYVYWEAALRDMMVTSD